MTGIFDLLRTGGARPQKTVNERRSQTGIGATGTVVGPSQTQRAPARNSTRPPPPAQDYRLPGRAEQEAGARTMAAIPLGGGGRASAQLTPDQRAANDAYSVGVKDLHLMTRDAPVIPEQYREPATGFPFPMAGQPDDSAARVAIAATGVDANYLANLNRQENPSRRGDAANPLSSAVGDGQFTRSTWLAMIRQHGAQYGVPQDVIDQIEGTGDNTRVRDGQTQARLLAMRQDPRWTALMAGHFTNDNVAALRAAMPGHTVTQGDVYMLHFGGSGAERGGLALVRAAHGPNANRPASQFVTPGAVLANPRVFYDGGRYERRQNPNGPGTYLHYLGGGRMRSARQVYELQTAQFRDENGRPLPYQGRATSVVGRSKQVIAGSTGTIQTAGDVTAAANQRDWQVRQGDQNTSVARDPITGAPITQTPEERRIQEEQARRDAAVAERQQRSQWGVSGGRVTYRRRF